MSDERSVERQKRTFDTVAHREGGPRPGGGIVCRRRVERHALRHVQESCEDVEQGTLRWCETVSRTVERVRVAAVASRAVDVRGLTRIEQCGRTFARFEKNTLVERYKVDAYKEKKRSGAGGRVRSGSAFIFPIDGVREAPEHRAYSSTSTSRAVRSLEKGAKLIGTLALALVFALARLRSSITGGGTSECVQEKDRLVQPF